MTVPRGLSRVASMLAAAVLVAALMPVAAADAATHIAAPTVTPSDLYYVVGTPVAFALAPGDDSAVPVGYQYQVDDGSTQSVEATAGNATVTFTPTKQYTVLWFAAIAEDGTVSGATYEFVGATAPSPAADKDMNGDGAPDLLIAGDTAGLASGLWLAPGRTDGTPGKVRIPATNIGVHGNGQGFAFDGGRAVSGHFAGTGFEDVLVYYPSGNAPGEGVVVKGSGDGSVLQSQYSINSQSIPSDALFDANGDSPLQLVDGYHSSGSDSAADDDLIGTTGSPVNGYHLAYYPNLGATGAYFTPTQLANATPTGGADWNDWTIATTMLPSGTAMYLWKQSTGELYLWTGVTVTDNGDMTGTAAYTQYKVSAHWLRDTPLSMLEMADLNADGVPDLWAVTPDGTVTAYLVCHLSTHAPATVRAMKPQHLS